MKLNVKYDLDKVGLKDIKFKSADSIPQAEKKFLFVNVVAFVVWLFFSLLSDRLADEAAKSLFFIGLFKYFFHDKFYQDEAVNLYYKEISLVSGNVEAIHSIYKNSSNVIAVGGHAALENACALQLFHGGAFDQVFKVK